MNIFFSIYLYLYFYYISYDNIHNWFKKDENNVDVSLLITSALEKIEHDAVYF